MIQLLSYGRWANKLNQRAMAIRNKGLFKKIDAMLKQRPDLASSVVAFLIDHGCQDPGRMGGGEEGSVADGHSPRGPGDDHHGGMWNDISFHLTSVTQGIQQHRLQMGSRRWLI